MSKIDKSEVLRHSTAHILAIAVLEMFPEVKFGTGPATKNGFYYDFDLPRTLIPEDLEILENKMKKIIKANYFFEKKEVSANNAIEHFKKVNQPYKLEIIKDIQKEKGAINYEFPITLYKSGPFVDLCSGPHLKSTKEINPDAFKLIKISGAYWKSNEKNSQMQRIYGVVFESKKKLKEYLQIIEEAEKRDHKKLGRELELYSFHPEAPGSAFWHPKGMIIWNIIENLGKDLRKKYNYKEIQTPILAKKNLWEISGHWNHYKDSIFHFELDKEIYCIKPMDCPFNIKMYQEKQRSYRELPIRYTEIGRVMRNEKSGELNGLLRVRHITQDDSHIFLAKKQIKKEIICLLKMAREYYSYFNIEPKFFLSTRPENFMGKIEDWNEAEKDLESALKQAKVNYKIKEKDGAFYGPKIDIDIEDALSRHWQLATIQLDFQLSQRFKLNYIDSDNKKKTPVIIHAAIFGSFERFIGIITEHYAGAFPTWLAPTQVIVIPVSEENFGAYGLEIKNKLTKDGVRVELDSSAESLSKKIRNAEKQKIPYMLVVGKKEMDTKSVAVRKRGDKNQKVLKVDEFVEKILDEITEKK